jgi:hypothetical protein
MARNLTVPNMLVVYSERAVGSVSKVEITTSMVLIYKVLFPSISTFETPPFPGREHG